ncbi:MAG TPA: hypothetical protein VFZ78_10545, partial [Flavisolibacter sp.]
AQNFFNLAMNGVAALLQVPVTVQNNLALTAGIINTSATALLTTGSAATITGGSSTAYVSGPLRRNLDAISGTLAFPVGKSNAYRPVVLTLTQAAASATGYTVEVIDGPAPVRTLPPTLASVSAVRHLNITCSNNSNVASASVQLSYGADDLVTDPAVLRIAKSNGSAWEDIGGSGTSIPAGTITSTGFSTFSDFVLARDIIVLLPVKWISFTAVEKSGVTQLRWETADEYNASHFDIEVSEDGNNWIKKGTVAARNAQRNVYTFEDRSQAAVRMYRLLQQDLDGRYSYSPVIRVAAPGSRDISVNGSQAAHSGILLIFIRDPLVLQQQDINIMVLDLYGRIVYQGSGRPSNVMRVPCGMLTAGRYMLVIQSGRDHIHKSFMTQ